MDSQRQVVTLPWKAWSPLEQEDFEFPASWHVDVLEMTGWDRDDAGWDSAALGSAVQELALGKTSISIAVDDLTRPIRVSALLDVVIDGAMNAGILDEGVDIVMALGSHGVPSREELRLKLGERALDFGVRAHNAVHGDFAETHVELAGAPLRVDRRFFEADVRIGLTSVIPNPFAGFSGGGKIVLPGLADSRALEWLHKIAMLGFGGGPGQTDRNKVYNAIVRVARELPLHLAVNCLVDRDRRVREAHHGEPAESHERAVTSAKTRLRTKLAHEYDVLICNAYPKDSEFLQVENAYTPLRTGAMEYLKENGSVVLMGSCHKGRGTHGLFDAGGSLHRAPSGPKAHLQGRDLIAYLPGIDREDFGVTHWSGYRYSDDWSEVVEWLVASHGPTARVGVFPCASIQLGPG
jgi:lactate racemase